MIPPRWFEEARARVARILADSRVPEDFGHAHDVDRWVLRLRPEAAGDWSLRLAAFAHDLDRALPDAERVHREDFSDYDDFKAAHAANSARVLAGLMRKAGAPSRAVRDAAGLVLHHERGGAEPRLRLLCDADALSFFTHNLPFFLLREGEARALERMRWGAARLSPAGVRALRAFPFADPRIRRMVKSLLN